MKIWQEMRRWWIGCGAAFGFTILSVALGSVPAPHQVTQDARLYENLSEIRAQKIRDLNFDSDIEHLAKLEGRYREKLPSLSQDARVRGPLSRITSRSSSYRPVSATTSTQSR